MSNLTFEYLDYKHEGIIQEFICDEEPSVAIFLKEHALRLHKLQSAITRLYFDENQNLIGFFTLFNDHVSIHKGIVKKENWELPNELSQFPAIKLHYFGVDSRFQRRGYGEYLLLEVIDICQDIVRVSGCNFLTLEAFENVVEFYKTYGFIRFNTRKQFIQGQRVVLTDMALKLGELD
ncbi:GNAT family N-acetyltransferase [Fodinisporobacter ferrooxydans]|uniref:GNAT family N-acetyltransferase n=1 Tax=Fodinisporobacter ferrooxydans TaxID=2901836 RepID=A0ABY4CJR9_9BACL|nr:GNAT family N-acetyltransferase [Alicyclobacillaceae bacterium MYW30-H2]